MNTNLPGKSNNPLDVSLQSVSLGGKEGEPGKIKSEAVIPVSHEAEIPKEVEKLGVTAISETIEIPPDVRKAGASVPVPPVVSNSAGSAPAVVLPITDQQVLSGLHIKNRSSGLKWLAYWCIRKLKMAHLTLKVINGKIRRVKE